VSNINKTNGKFSDNIFSGRNFLGKNIRKVTWRISGVGIAATSPLGRDSLRGPERFRAGYRQGLYPGFRGVSLERFFSSPECGLDGLLSLRERSLGCHRAPVPAYPELSHSLLLAVAKALVLIGPVAAGAANLELARFVFEYHGMK